jgi:kexin
MGETLAKLPAFLIIIYRGIKKPKNIRTLSILIPCIFINVVFFQNCLRRSNFKIDSSIQSPNLFGEEWHLKNTGALGGLAGQDLNIEPVWLNSIKGKDINIAVIDTGIQLNHTDLLANASPLSWNFAAPEKGTDTSSPGSAHGTCVAGIIGAVDNGYGVIGVAPLAKLIGYNISGWTDAYEQGALSGVVEGVSYISQIDVSNNSWGPRDSTGAYSREESFWTQALETGLTNGRGGLGTVYVWAAGNGGSGELTDRSNYDGYSGFYGVISVCAAGDSGQKADYSESGSNLWVCGYGGDSISGQLIVTTDYEGSGGYNRGGNGTGDFTDSRYTRDFAGTSAAAPMVSGVVALVLEKAKTLGKDLSWRDVKWILAKSAKHPPSVIASTNGYGLKVYDGFGFGIIDANAAVNLVSSWTPVGVPKNAIYPSSGLQTVNSAIPNATAEQYALSSSLTVSDSPNPTGINRIEFVDLNINLSHPNWSELEIRLSHTGIVTGGTASFTLKDIIATAHSCVSENLTTYERTVVNCAGFDNGGSSSYSFRFGVSRHLGENPVGEWNLKVYDSNNNSNSGTLQSWGLKFYGE